VEKQPLITTVIPTYKRPVLLKKAVLSALNQTFSNIQVIVYDNCSADRTKEVIEEIAKQDSRLKYYCHSHPIPAAENFRFGFSAVKTPFFSVLADDDLLFPHFYETALTLFECFPAAYFCLGSTVDCSAAGKIISAEALKWNREYFEPPSGVFEVIQKYFNWTGALFKKEVLEQVHIDPTVKPIDYDFVLRLAARFPFAISKKPCAQFTIHPASYSLLNGLKLFWPSWPKITQNVLDALTHFPIVQSQVQILLQHKLKNNLFRLVINLVARKRFEESEKVIDLYSNEFKGDKTVTFLRFFFGFFKRCACLTGVVSLALKAYRIRQNWRLHRFF
jgi:glycosyltransferase involved in cell wall biosynthesis